MLGLGALLALATVALGSHIAWTDHDTGRLHALFAVSVAAAALVLALDWTLVREKPPEISPAA